MILQIPAYSTNIGLIIAIFMLSRKLNCLFRLFNQQETKTKYRGLSFFLLTSTMLLVLVRPGTKSYSCFKSLHIRNLYVPCICMLGIELRNFRMLSTRKPNNAIQNEILRIQQHLHVASVVERIAGSISLQPTKFSLLR